MISKIITALIRALFPPKCLVCRNLFHHPEEAFPAGRRVVDGRSNGNQEAATFAALTAGHLCGECVNGFLPLSSPLCTCCGTQFNSRVGEDHLCGQCLHMTKAYGIARAAGIYDDVLMRAIHRYKYAGKIQLAEPLGKFLWHTFLRFWQPQKVDLVLPVPLHIKRQRRRGFNQAYLLIKKWYQAAAEIGIEWPRAKIDCHVLTRPRPTMPQTGLNRRDRLRNIKNAFRVQAAGRVKGRHVLLVDDVYTTGATVGECAQELLKNGAKHVDVLTLARAIRNKP